jgi:activator of HSP90 ATPase
MDKKEDENIFIPPQLIRCNAKGPFLFELFYAEDKMSECLVNNVNVTEAFNNITTSTSTSTSTSNGTSNGTSTSTSTSNGTSNGTSTSTSNGTSNGTSTSKTFLCFVHLYLY